jgi:hypothetical protein
MDERIRQSAYDQGDSHKYDNPQSCFTHKITQSWLLLTFATISYLTASRRISLALAVSFGLTFLITIEMVAIHRGARGSLQARHPNLKVGVNEKLI